MGDFFASPGGFPEVPVEPATPPPDFANIGVNFTLGSEAAKKQIGWWANLGDEILQIIAKVLGGILSWALTFFAYLIGIMGNVTEEAGASYGKIVAATLKELFGVTVNPADVNTRASGPNRAAVAASLGQAIIGTLFSAAPVNAAGGVPPSDAAANNFLRVTMNMELNGWLESWFADAATYHLLEKYGDLKDGIGRILGLGRMSRQVFAPPLKVLVHDPYLALLNQKYRPKAVDVGTAMRAFHRGDVDRNGLTTLLATQGYTEQEIDWLVLDHTKYIPDADIDYLVSRNIWTHQQATDYLRHQGWDATSSQYVLEIQADKRLQKYRDQLASAASDAYVRGEITEAQLTSALQSAGLLDIEQQYALLVANSRRDTHITHLSLGQIEQGIRDGVLNYNDLKAWATRNNMPETEELELELILQVEANKLSAATQAKAARAKAAADAQAAQVKAAADKAAAGKAAAPDKGITVAEAEALVKSGDWSFVQLTAFLTSKGYGSDAIAAIELLLHEQLAKQSANAATTGTVRAAAKAKGLNLPQMEKAVVDGILTVDTLRNWLVSEGFSADDSAVLVAEVQHAVDDAKVRAATKAAAAATAGKRGISLPNLERAVRLGITPLQTYTDTLQRLNYEQSSIDLLTGTLRAQLAQDAAAKAGKGSTTGPTPAKAATLPQIEQEVVAGVRPIGDYTAALKAANYAGTDVEQLTELLQAKVDHSAAAQLLHSDAVGQATARGINLAQAEAAVIGGINTLDDYDAMLTTLGYDDVDRQTLEALLLAKVQAKATAAAGKKPVAPPTA